MTKLISQIIFIVTFLFVLSVSADERHETTCNIYAAMAASVQVDRVAAYQEGLPVTMQETLAWADEYFDGYMVKPYIMHIIPEVFLRYPDTAKPYTVWVQTMEECTAALEEMERKYQEQIELDRQLREQNGTEQ